MKRGELWILVGLTAMAGGLLSTAPHAYLAVVDAVGDVQAQAYRTLWAGNEAVAMTLEENAEVMGAAVAGAIVAGTDPMAQWYMDMSASVSGRLELGR